MCASSRPPTTPHGLLERDGAPVTPTSDSGNGLQPSAGAKANVEAVSPSDSAPPFAASLRPATVSVKAPVVPSTVQSASALGAAALPTVASPVLARKSPALP